MCQSDVPSGLTGRSADEVEGDEIRVFAELLSNHP